MVEARLLAEFRSTQVPVQRLRPAVVLVRREFGRYPLAHARPFLEAEGRELVRFAQDRSGLESSLQLVVVRDGQTMLAAATDRFPAAVDYNDDGIVSRLRPDLRTPRVPMDPGPAFGSQPFATSA